MLHEINLCCFFFPLRSMMMTACDLGAVTKPWEISRKVTKRFLDAPLDKIMCFSCGAEPINQSING